MRVISSIFFSAASFYLLAILAIVLSNLANGEGVGGAGSSLILVPSLLGLMIFFGWIPAVIFGIVSGTVISLSWKWTTRSTRNLLLTSLFITLGYVGLVIAGMFQEALETPQYEGIRWSSVLPALVMALIIFAANVISISLTKWFHPPSPQP